MITYLFTGCVWAIWMEWFTTNKLAGKYAEHWTIQERIVHVTLWPVFVSIFLYNFFKDNRW